jgi:tetratricopeptide (TPR) repeat protein
MDVSVSLALDRGSAAVVQAQIRSEFVGRERELAELLDALEHARHGRGRAVLVGGEPGIGKSRLADELAVAAEEAGCRLLWGRGWEDAGAPAYWPWIQALRTLIRTTSRDALVGYLSTGAADIAQMLPEIHALVPDLPQPTGSESEGARFRLFDSTATLLRNAAADVPVLLVLDDLHAADTPSILLLRFIASQLADMPILMVGTYRDLELTPEHPLTLAISEMARERTTRLMMLGGLGSDAISDYISAATDIRPDGLTVAAVWRETNGNPLFVGEAVKLLEAEGTLGDVADLASLRIAVPAGVREVIARRVAHLSPAAGTALTMGAALGPEFNLDVLRRIGELEPAQTIGAVDEAVRAGLLSAVPGVAGRFRFSHDLVRETLYEQLSTARRASLHRRIGDALEVVYATAVDAHLAELAFHFAQATQLRDFDSTADRPDRTREKAIDYARRAGDHAVRALAYEDAGRLYVMSLASLDVGSAADASARADLLLAIGDACVRSGDLDRGRVAFLEAADMARALDSGSVFARAALGYGGRHQWVRAGNDTVLIPLLEEAVSRLGDLDDRLRIRLLTRLSGAWRSDPDKRADCARVSQEAIDLAREIDDRESLGYALAGRYWATWWPENPEERQQLSGEIVELAESIGDDERLAEGHLVRVLSLFELGRFREAGRRLARLNELVRSTRQPAHLWLGPVHDVVLALFQGDYRLAEDGIPEESGYRVTPARDDVSAARMHRFLLRREQGRGAEEERYVRSSVVEFPWYPMHRAALCCLLIDANQTDEARAIFNDLATNQFEAIYRDNEFLLGTALASNACALLGDATQAAVLYDRLAPFSGRHAIGNAEGSIGVVDAYLGQLAATMDRLDDADTKLTAAIAQLDKEGGRPWKAHAEHDLADVLRRRGRPGDAERAAQLDGDALRTAEELGMSLARQISPIPEGSRGDERQPQSSFALDRARLVREGDYWAVNFGPDSFRLRDSKGMHHLARLLRSPGTELHAVELVRADAPAEPAAHRSAEGLEVGDTSDTGPVLDAEAKAAYRGRLRDIDEDTAEAERWNDPERVALLEQERQALVHELSVAVGLGNRDRAGATSSAERARVSVTRAIRASMERITEYSPGLGAHLEATIRTGTFCAYVPDPRAPIAWDA